VFLPSAGSTATAPLTRPRWGTAAPRIRVFDPRATFFEGIGKNWSKLELEIK